VKKIWQHITSVAAISLLSLFLYPSGNDELSAQSNERELFGHWCLDLGPQEPWPGDVARPEEIALRIIESDGSVSTQETLDLVHRERTYHDEQTFWGAGGKKTLFVIREIAGDYEFFVSYHSNYIEYRLNDEDGLVSVGNWESRQETRDGTPPREPRSGSFGYEEDRIFARCAAEDFSRILAQHLEYQAASDAWFENRTAAYQARRQAFLDRYDAETARLQAESEARAQRHRQQGAARRSRQARELGQMLGNVLGGTTSFVPPSSSMAGQSTAPGLDSCERQLREVMQREQSSAVGLCESGQALVNVGRAAKAIAPSCGAAQSAVMEQAHSFEQQGQNMMCRTCSNVSC